ncbi:hypothetical protein [Lactococcus petauri]|uniref:hypothetical protein n=1 Tax=Lactococcus petauri TaxID=1940789 RepID=UPI003851C716
MGDHGLDIDEYLIENNIPIIWAPADYFEPGSYIPKCDEFPNGAIIVRLGMNSDLTRWTKIHETTHIIEGTQILTLTSPLKHYNNEFVANSAMIREEVPSFVEENENCLEHATAARLCERLSLSINEYCSIAEEEIKDYVRDKYGILPNFWFWKIQ